MNLSRKVMLSDLKSQLEKESQLEEKMELNSTGSIINEIGSPSIAEILQRLLKHRILLLSSFNTTGVEDATNTILIKIAEKPCRASELAQVTFCDPSTIARQVKHLLAEKLVKRVPDMRDGRATILLATPLGVARAKKIVDLRNEYYAEVFSTWDHADRQKFFDYLLRFVTDTERVTEDYLR